MGQRYGFALYNKQTVREHSLEAALIVQRDLPVRKVFELAFTRQSKDFNDDVTVWSWVNARLLPCFFTTNQSLTSRSFSTTCFRFS